MIYFFLINIVTLLLYGLDKRAAIKQKWRISNRVLIGFAAFGGSIGALIGMYTFKHKTKTKLYTVAVPLLLIIQIIVVMLLLSSCGTEMATSAGSIGTANEQSVEGSDEFESTDDIDFESEEDEESLVSDEVSDQDEPVMTYVLNTNTKKFHYPDCRSVSQMKDKNKQEVEATREEVIARGFDPCGNCNP